MANVIHESLFNHYGYNGAVGAATNFAVDANNDGWGVVFQPETTDAITHVGFRYGARTGTPPTYTIQIEGVDASGFPDGADIGGGSPTAVTFTPPADTSINGLWQWKTLTNSYNPTDATPLALTIRYSSGTIDGSNFSSFTRSLVDVSASSHGFPYAVSLTAGTWAANAGTHIFGYKTATERHGTIVQGVFTTNTSTSGQRSTMKFNIPATRGSTYQVAGFRCVARLPAAAGSYKYGLYNAAGTALQEVTMDSDHISAAGTTLPSRFFFDIDSLATLSNGTDYYIGFESVSSSTVGLKGYQLAEADDRTAFSNGTNRCYSLWNGASWADDTTVVPQLDLILADITVASGGAAHKLWGKLG